MRFQKSDNFLPKGFNFVPFLEIEVERYGAIEHLFGAIRQRHICKRIVERKADARIARQLHTVFAPIFDNRNIGWAAPSDGTVMDVAFF